MISGRNILLFFTFTFLMFSIAGYTQNPALDAEEKVEEVLEQPTEKEESTVAEPTTEKAETPTNIVPTEKEDKPQTTAESSTIEEIKEVLTSPYDSLRVYSWTVNQMGERTFIPFDTVATNYGQSLLTDSRSAAMAYLGNLGSPALNMVFFERPERSDFIFADAYHYYHRQPNEFHFLNAKLPYANITYNNGGKKGDNAEQFNGAMAINFGKKFNVGFDFDYLYGRGQYASQSAKDINTIIHANYISDKYELNALFYNTNFLNYENGGLSDDRYITDPDIVNEGVQNKYSSKNFPVRFTDTWNHVKGQQYYFTHRYNLGYYSTVGKNEKGEKIERFTPVASIFHTFNFKSNNRRFVSNNAGLDTIYTPVHYLPLQDSTHLVDDRTSYWSLSNTAGISLREGFKKWVKFGLSAYVNIDYRSFTLPGNNSILFPTHEKYNEFATKVGGELAKREGALFTYRANAEIGLKDIDAGEMRLDGEVRTLFPLFGKEFSVKGNSISPPA